MSNTIPGGGFVRGTRRSERLGTLRPLLSLICLTLAACGTTDSVIVATDSPDAPDLASAEISIVSGDDQEAEVATPAAGTLVVQVVDQFGDPFVGAPVEWTFTHGRGTANGSAPNEVLRVNTDAEGHSEVEWMLGNRAGPQEAAASIVLPATVAGASGPSLAPGGNGRKQVTFQASGKPGRATDVSLSPGEAEVPAFDTLRLVANVTDRHGNAIDSVDLSWQSSDEGLVVVDDSGLVWTGPTPGAAAITARTGSAAGTANLIVMTDDPGNPVDPARVADLRVVSVSGTSVGLRWTQVADGGGGAADYALRSAEGTLVWSNAAGSEVTIPGSSPGADIDFTVSGLSGSTEHEFQVLAYRGVRGSGEVAGPPSDVVAATTAPADAVVDRVSVTPSGVWLEEGETMTFQASALDASGTPVDGMTINWSTSNGQVLALEGPGQVRAVGEGTASVIAWADGVSGSQGVVVTPIGGGEPGNPVFAIDWGTATGKSVEALTDGNRFGLVGFPSDAQLTVVPLADLGLAGWPTNGLELSFLPSTSSLVGRTNGWPAPAPGESIYYRYLVYHDMPNGRSISLDHGNQSNIGAIRHQFYLTNSSGEAPTEDHWAIGFRAYNAGEYFQYFAPDLPERTPIRVEWRLHRQATGVTARVEIRIYDETISRTVPQWTEFDFVDNYGAGTNSLGVRDPVIDMGNESEGFRSYMMGISGSGPSTACCITVGAFAVSLDGWLGPYVPGEGN